MTFINKNLVLYSTGCIACKTLKMILDKEGITYVENNSTEKMSELGFTHVPILEVDGVFLNYDAAKRWIQEQSKGDVK